MKIKEIGIMFYFISLSILGFGQKVPPKANLIIFKSDSLNNFELFKEGVMILKNEGYSFDQLDKDFYLCSTKPVKPDRLYLEYRLDISVIDNKIEIRSFVKSLNNFSSYSGGLSHKTENSWERGAKRGLSSSLWRYGWDKQIELTDKVKEKISGSISYMVEENK